MSDLHLIAGKATVDLVSTRATEHDSLLLYLPQGAPDIYGTVPVVRTHREMVERLYQLQDDPPHNVSGELVKFGGISPAAFTEIQQLFQQAIDGMASNKHTLETSGEQWMRNAIANLPNMLYAQNAKEVSLPSGTPMVIIGAGPSLDKNIHLLKELEGKAYLFAAQHALGALEYAGIQINAVGCADSDPICVEHMGQYKRTIPNAFFGPFIDPKIWGDTPGTVLFSDMLYGKVVSQAMGEDLGVASCDSVTTIMFGLAMKWQCDPIIFVGQDLSTEVYAQHTGPRLHTQVETSIVKGFHGGKVETMPVYDRIRKWFEGSAKEARKRDFPIHFWNCTEGGAYIDGFEHMPLKVALGRQVRAGMERDLSLISKPLGVERVAKRRNSILSYLYGLMARTPGDDALSAVKKTIAELSA